METEFNWFTELDNAIKAEPTDEQFMYLSDMAKNWVTCHYGQLCKKLPRRRGAPEDSYATIAYLYANSTEFSEAVQNKDWFYAKIVLKRIEKRTIELLKALN